MKRTVDSLNGQRRHSKRPCSGGLLILGIGGPSVLGANVGTKLFVTLGLVLLLHLDQ